MQQAHAVLAAWLEGHSIKEGFLEEGFERERGQSGREKEGRCGYTEGPDSVVSSLSCRQRQFASKIQHNNKVT